LVRGRAFFGARNRQYFSKQARPEQGNRERCENRSRGGVGGPRPPQHIDSLIIQSSRQGEFARSSVAGHIGFWPSLSGLKQLTRNPSRGAVGEVCGWFVRRGITDISVEFVEYSARRGIVDVQSRNSGGGLYSGDRIVRVQ
jgi:hypothetical protein